LFIKAIVLGYKRGLRNQRPSHVLIKISGTKRYTVLEPYLGKKVFYSTGSGNNCKKFLWGKIISMHGKSGAFIAKFSKQLPPSSFSSFVYVTPFPHRVKKMVSD